MLRFVFNLLLSLLILGIVLTITISWYFIPSLPNIEVLKNIKMQVPLRIYSADLSLIAEFGEKKRIPVKIDDVPEKMIEAFLAAEDDRFYDHPGVDWHGIARATYSLLKTGSKQQGGSTITMQVARNFFLKPEKTYIRKLNEILLALKIERELTKDKIFELYLNKIYLGQRAYGVAAAAQVYYGKTIDALTLSQIAMIAGLPKAPSTTNPIRNPERALIRRDYVLKRMSDLSFITQEEYNAATNMPVTASLHVAPIEIEAPYIAEMVRSMLIEQRGESVYNSGLVVTTTITNKNQNAANQALRHALLAYDKRHGYRGPEGHIDDNTVFKHNDPNTSLERFAIIGNLYPAIIKHVEDRSIRAYVANIGQVTVSWDGLKWARRYISENRRGAVPKKSSDILRVGDIVRLEKTEDDSWVLSQVPAVEGALVSINPNTGSVLALVGGFDFYKNKFNRVTQAKRQSGSGFKPFIYSAGLAAGKNAATIINDAPLVLRDIGTADEWRPQNYSKKHYGPTRLKEALTHSRNVVSIKLLMDIGIPFALTHITKFGFSAGDLPGTLSMALGTAESTPWDMAKAYSVFANGGFLIDPYFVQEIKTLEDEVIFSARPLVACNQCADNKEAQDSVSGHSSNTILEQADIPRNTAKNQSDYAPRVVSPQNIWIMNSILRNVIENGTGRKALQLARKDLSGKTGTTNDQRDAWFSGFNANIATICWLGFDDFTSLGKYETGSKAALPMWIDYMKIALEGMPNAIMDRPKGLVNIRIDKYTGQRVTTNTPDSIFEVFRADNIPKIIEENDKENKALTTPEQLF